MISLLGNSYSTVKLVETPVPLSIEFFIVISTHPMMCILVQFWPFRHCKAISGLIIVALDNDKTIGRRMGSLWLRIISKIDVFACRLVVDDVMTVTATTMFF
jgi:hypothetical protein